MRSSAYKYSPQTDTGAAFIEAAIVITGFLAIVLLGYLFLLPKIKNRIYGIDLEQAMDLIAVVGPEPIVYEFQENGTFRRLLPPTIRRSALLRLSNRVSANTNFKVSVGSALYQIPTTSVCNGSTPFPDPGAFQLIDCVPTGDNPNVSCDAGITTNTFGCLTKLSQLVKIDCTQQDRVTWGVVIFPILPGYERSCGVMSTRMAQAVTGGVRRHTAGGSGSSGEEPGGGGGDDGELY